MQELKEVDLRVANHYNCFVEEEKAYQIKAQKIWLINTRPRKRYKKFYNMITIIIRTRQS